MTEDGSVCVWPSPVPADLPSPAMTVEEIMKLAGVWGGAFAGRGPEVCVSVCVRAGKRNIYLVGICPKTSPSKSYTIYLSKAQFFSSVST